MDDTENKSPESTPIEEDRPDAAASGKVLSPAAIRALEEAAARRKAQEDLSEDGKPIEYNGPSGQEPTRFGDWERKGVAYDF